MSQARASFDFLKMTLARALGMRFFGSVILITMVFFLDTEPSVRSVLFGKYLLQEHQGIAYYLGTTLRYGVNYKLFLIFMTMGYAIDFPFDWKNNAVPAVVRRLGINSYSTIQVVIAALSGGLAAGAGFLIYIFALRSRLPIIATGEGMELMHDFLIGMPYHMGISTQDIQIYIVCITTLLFLSGVAGTAIAMAVSVYLNNAYIVLVAPFLLHRVYIEIAKVFQIPAEFRVDLWFAGMVQPFAIPICLLILSGISLMVVLLCKILFAKCLKWRLENG